MKKYKSYSTYKPSGVEWLGEIPLHWEVIRLKHICWRAANYGANESSESYLEEGVRFLRTTDIDEFGNLSSDGAVFLEHSKVADYKLDDGDILISRSGTIGRSFLYSKDKHGECAFAGYLVRFSLRDKYLPKFIFYFTKSRAFLDYIGISIIQSTIGNVNGQKYANMSLSIPHFKEQEDIVSFLDRETTHIDTLITKKRELINLLQHKHTIIITNAVTKGIEPNVLMKDSGVAWIGEVPKHWQVKRIKFVCRLETGHTPNRSEESYWIEEECTIPWVSLNDTKTLAVLDYISETKYNISPTGMANSSAHLIEPGAVVFTRDATIGLAAITTEFMAVSQHIIAWVCLPDIYNRFLLHIIYAMNNELERLTMGSTIKTIGMPDVKNLRMPIPPLEEQVKIIDKLNKKKQMIEKAIVKIEEQINELCNKRQALITDAVTGKIDVRQVERGAT